MTSSTVAPGRRSYLILMAACIVAWGCGPGYPRVSSRESLELLLALRTACSTQNQERLRKVEEALEQAQKESKVSEAEADALRRIIALARQGDWHKAERACRAFQKAQLR